MTVRSGCEAPFNKEPAEVCLHDCVHNRVQDIEKVLVTMTASRQLSSGQGSSLEGPHMSPEERKMTMIHMDKGTQALVSCHL